MNAKATTELGLLLVALASGAALVYVVLGLFGVIDQGSAAACITATGPSSQPTTPPADPPVLHWPGVQILVCFLGFAGGNLIGHRRLRHVTDQPSELNVVLQVAMVALFSIGSAALVWETFAVAHNDPRVWPITYFVRCAGDVYAVPTLVAALVVSILVGHWLGFQVWWRRIR